MHRQSRSQRLKKKVVLENGGTSVEGPFAPLKRVQCYTAGKDIGASFALANQHMTFPCSVFPLQSLSLYRNFGCLKLSRPVG